MHFAILTRHLPVLSLSKYSLTTPKGLLTSSVMLASAIPSVSYFEHRSRGGFYAGLPIIGWDIIESPTPLPHLKESMPTHSDCPNRCLADIHPPGLLMIPPRCRLSETYVLIILSDLRPPPSAIASHPPVLKSVSTFPILRWLLAPIPLGV